jgi:hypothetical protein
LGSGVGMYKPLSVGKLWKSASSAETVLVGLFVL